jgi:hypothetical protein
LFTFLIVYIFNYLEKRRKDKQKDKQPSLSSKKQRNNSKNKENVIEIIELDEDSHLEEQKKMNDLAQEMLIIQRLERRNQILGL